MQRRVHPMRSTRARVSVWLCVLGILALLLVGCSDDHGSRPTSTDAPVAAATPTTSTNGDEIETLDELPSVVQQVSPSVVAIRTDTGEGSGVIWDDSGHVVTNNHVIAGASSITVILVTGVQVDADLVGTDPVTDIALLHVDEEGLPPLERASDLPPSGTAVMAIGNPLGFENSVSFGVVSGLRRSIPGGDPSLVDLMQTDAAISPGNSGGALVDLDGRLVGVTVAYIPPASSAVSIGFAVPVTTASFVVEQLSETGRVNHAYLGVSLVTLTPALAQQFELDVDTGALVQTVAPGSPAADAGIEPGDIVRSVDGDEVSTAEDVIAAVRMATPGSTMDLDIQPYGPDEEHTVTVTLATRPSR